MTHRGFLSLPITYFVVLKFNILNSPQNKQLIIHSIDHNTIDNQVYYIEYYKIHYMMDIELTKKK